MARTNQRLINYHGSIRNDSKIQSNLVKGEIAVLHVDANGTMLGTLDNTDKIVWFISSGAVESAIVTLSGNVYSAITAITETEDSFRQEYEGLSSYTFNNVARIDSGLTAVSAKTATALQSVSAEATTGSVANNYIKAEAGAVTGSDFEKTQKITVTLDVNTAMSGANATGQVADAKVVKDYVDAQTTALQGQIDSVNSGLTNLSSTTVYALSGLTIDGNNSIKTYVDEKVSTTISSVYRVKGTQETYDELPSTGNEIGDVWNVTSSVTVDDKVYPAGTNWVWTEDGWDALGGTVDLSPYATKHELMSLGSRVDNKLNIVNANAGFETTGTTYLTSSQNKSGSGDTVSGIVTYTINVSQDIASESATGKVADAKAVKDYGVSLFNSATTYASALTATEEERAKNTETALEHRIDAISGSVTGVTFAELGDVTYVQEGEAAHTTAMENQSGVAAQIENNTLKLDLDCLVVDCGTF